MTGYFYLQRGLFDHPHFATKKPFSPLESWIWLIEHANFESSKYRFKSAIFDIPRGALATSYRALAAAWHWSVNRVIRELNLFQKQRMVELKTEHGFLHVTICNYIRYQEPWKVNGTLTEQQRNTDGTATNTNQINTKKVSKVIKEEPPTPLPEWMPVDLWNTYLEMRRQKKSPPTSKAIIILIAKLDSWRAKGHDPSVILEKSITSNWTDLYEPKGSNYEATGRNSAHTNQPTKAERGKAAVRRAAIAGGFAPEEWLGEQEGAGDPFIP